MRRKRGRKPRRKSGAPYMAGDVRIEDAGPPPEGPIIGFRKAAKSTTEPENGKTAVDAEAASIVERAVNKVKH